MNTSPDKGHARSAAIATAVGLVVVLGLAAGGGESRDPAALSGTVGPATTQAAQSPAPQEPARDGQEPASRGRLASGLIGSKHDFRHLNVAARDLCLPCHTPHLTATPVPRWDLRPVATPPLQPFRQFDVELSGWSLLCLGCHDGVTARDVFTSSHAVTIAEPLRRAGFGTRGLRSHPVGVKYPASRADYHTSAEVEATGLSLPGGRIQCTTCHDAHNTQGHPGFLRISNRGSALCLACHRL